MARVLLPEEELSVEYRVLKRSSDNSAALIRRRVVLFSIAVVLTLIVVLPILGRFVWTRNAETAAATQVVTRSREDSEATAMSSGPRISELAHTESTTRTASTAGWTRLPSASMSSQATTEFEPSPASSQSERVRSPMRLNTSNLEQWKSFISGSERVTEVPPELRPSSKKIMDKNMGLYLEMHDGEYCIAVFSKPETFTPQNDSSVFHTPQVVLVDHFANYYRRLRYNLTATQNLFEINLKIIAAECSEQPVIPVKQIRELPPGEFFVKSKGALR